MSILVVIINFTFSALNPFCIDFKNVSNSIWSLSLSNFFKSSKIMKSFSLFTFKYSLRIRFNFVKLLSSKPSKVSFFSLTFSAKILNSFSMLNLFFAIIIRTRHFGCWDIFAANVWAKVVFPQPDRPWI